MNSALNSVRRFLVNHSVWMHFTFILILAYLMIHVSHFVLPKIYGYWVLGLIIFSIPMLAFVVYRDIKSKWRGGKYWVLWSIIFLAYPLALFLFKTGIDTLPFGYRLANFDITGAYTFSSLSVLYVLLELVLFWTNRRPFKSVNLSNVRRLEVFKIAIVCVAIFCVFAMLSNNYFYEVTSGDSGILKIAKFFYYIIQLFIIYLSYYIYYYIHHNILYKNVLKEKGLISYIIGLGLTVILITPIHNLMISFFPVVQDLKLHPIALSDLFDDFNFGLTILALIISFPMIVIIEWYKQVNTLAELERQKSEAELNLLKQQINPHFFFNTLNNLYAMSLDQDKETPETILQLSEMMRYVIYKGKEEKVKLSEEVKYMKDYINLQMIRVHKSVDLKVDFDIENEDLEIAPLLFIILLENAFKHGIEPAAVDGTLYISLKENEGRVQFECYNSKPLEAQNGNVGIGLNNLKKRLQILYPDQHELTINDMENYYKATLILHI